LRYAVGRKEKKRWRRRGCVWSRGDEFESLQGLEDAHYAYYGTQYTALTAAGDRFSRWWAWEDATVARAAV
jgi:hypothetical protein